MTQPQIGDIGFLAGRSIIDCLIEFFDHGKFNHVFIVMNDNNIAESQYFVNTRIIPNPYPDSEVTYLSLNLTDEQKTKLLELTPTYLKDKYDLLQILGIFLHDVLDINTNITWNDKHKLICSELIIDLLYGIGYLTDDEYKELKDATPNILFEYLYNRLTKVS